MSLSGIIQRLQVPMVFFLSFLFGWGSYSLKLVSIIKLIEDLGIKSFPVMMLLQAIVFLGFGRGMDWISKKMPKLIHPFVYFICGTLVLSVNLLPKLFHLSNTNKILMSGVTFLGSVVLVSAYELSTKFLQSQTMSILKFPNQAQQLMLMTEFGIILGGAGVLILHQNLSLVIPFWGALPFFIGLPLTLLLVDQITPKEKTSQEKLKFPVQQYPFYVHMILLMGIIYVVKYVQGLATMFGMIEMEKLTSSGIAVVFSKLNIIQTVMIIIALIPSFFRKKSIDSWGSGVGIYFSVQGILLCGLAFYSPVYALVGAGMVRKLLQHLFLSKSTSLLESSIPIEIRAVIRRHQEYIGQTASYIFMAIASSMIMFTSIPRGVLWACGGILALSVGLYVRKKLQDRLDEFQVGTIVKSDLYSAVAACYTLANKFSARHHMALVSLLQMMPRPMLAKAIIFSLGKMGRRQSIPVIINYLEKNDREDIQLVGINALSNFKGHELDLYYTHTLENLIKRQTALGELRLDVFTAIADRILSVATLTVLKVLEESAGNHNAIANCLNLLGIIAVKNNDHELYDILAKYLDISYPRRVRSNAIMYLYRSKKYQHLALEGIDAFMTSKDAFDRSAVAFVAGELKLTGLLPYVIECSIELQHNNSTLLVSLLKLKYKESFKWFVDYIVSANDKETLTALNQFHTIKNQSIRYAVYFELIKSHPAKISYILDMLRNTKRNFDQDRQAIVNEATNVGIELVKDNELFTVAPVVESSNTPVPAEIPKAA